MGKTQDKKDKPTKAEEEAAAAPPDEAEVKDSSTNMKFNF